jgi:hypothetical protein
LSKLSIFPNILIFIYLLLPVPCNTSEKREQNSQKIIWLQFLHVDKLIWQIFVSNQKINFENTSSTRSSDWTGQNIYDILVISGNTSRHCYLTYQDVELRMLKLSTVSFRAQFGISLPTVSRGAELRSGFVEWNRADGKLEFRKGSNIGRLGFMTFPEWWGFVCECF